MNRILAFFLFLVSTLAFAWQGETRFGINDDVTKMKFNAPKTTMKSSGETYWVESVALLDAAAKDVFLASLDYDHYEDFAPYVIESHLLESNIPQPRNSSEAEQHSEAWRTGQISPVTLPMFHYIWAHMRYKGSFLGISKTINSKYYMEVESFQNAESKGDFAIRWHMTNKKQDWKYPTDPNFSILDGSWYILPLGTGRTYVRYFIKIKTDTWVPNRIVRSVLSDSLESGVRKLVLAIKDRAKPKK